MGLAVRIGMDPSYASEPGQSLIENLTYGEVNCSGTAFVHLSSLPARRRRSAVHCATKGASGLAPW